MDIELRTLNLTTDIRLILNGLCRISSKRPIRYSLNTDESEPESLSADSVLIINGEDDSSLRQWEELKTQDPALKTIVFNNAELHDNVSTYSVSREKLGMKFLNVLDGVVKSRGEASAKTEDANSEQIVAKQNVDSAKEQLKQSFTAASPVSKKTASTYSALDRPSMLGRKKALIIDDSASVRRQLKEFLEKQNLIVEEASTAHIAIEKTNVRSYDIIFLDIVMPEMDGYKACKLLKKQRLAKDTPVVMLTSKSSTFNRARGILAGCDAYLTKPVKASLLKKVLWEKVEVYVYA